GVGGLGLGDLKVDDRDLDRLQAIITSMTPEERAHPEILNGSRRRRIARGSGTTIQAVNQLVKQLGQMQKVMRQLQQGKLPSLSQLAGGRYRSRASPVREGSEREVIRDLAVRVRLTRVGSRKNPIWRVVVADQRSPRDRRVIETVGRYNAQLEPSLIELDEERLRHWLDRGAQPSDTVRRLMRIKGISAPTAGWPPRAGSGEGP